MEPYFKYSPVGYTGKLAQWQHWKACHEQWPCGNSQKAALVSKQTLSVC